MLVRSAGVIAADVLRGYRQPMAIMNWVYPITALYWGPIAAALYFRRGRQTSHKRRRQHGSDISESLCEEEPEPTRLWPFATRNRWPISKGVSHCGAGCTLGDICGEWIVYLTGWTITILARPAANTLTSAVAFLVAVIGHALLLSMPF